MDASAPITQLPPPSSERKPVLGSLIIAMLVGALLTIAGLYAWGSQIAAEQQATKLPE